MKVAFLFPGQGSQHVGMGHAYVKHSAGARQLFERADEVLGFSLSRLCFEGPEEELRLTENAQPALFAASVAAWTVWQEECAHRPQAVAGHSVGEYAALVAAGVLAFEDGLKLVRKRGELMAEAGRRTPGTMAAVLGLSDEQVRVACDEAKQDGAGLVTIANYNGGGQVVISGEPTAVAKASEAAKGMGAKRILPLNVAGAFHSPLMVTAGDALFAHLSRTPLRKPQLPIVSNVTAKYVEMPDDLTGGLTMQVSRSVLWEQSMQLLLADGFDAFVELGCGHVLTGLIRRIGKPAYSHAVKDIETLREACAVLDAA